MVYLRNGTGSPLLGYAELAQRWGVSKATVGRYLGKLRDFEYITVLSYPGTHGSVICLNNYLSTMFEVSDVLVDKDEIAMVLHIGVTLPDTDKTESLTAFQKARIAFQNRTWNLCWKKSGKS